VSADHEETLAPREAPEDRLASTDVALDEPAPRTPARTPVRGLSTVDWWSWLRLILIDIAVGVSWALLLAGAVLFITGVSQFIYVDF
jgi:hypothetical protein